VYIGNVEATQRTGELIVRIHVDIRAHVSGFRLNRIGPVENYLIQFKWKRSRVGAIVEVNPEPIGFPQEATKGFQERLAD
jgi:hypothetical protein